MPLSTRPQRPDGAPRYNHYVDRFADQAAAAGLTALARELRGRPALTGGDIAEVEVRLAAGHAALDRLAIDLEYHRPAFLAEGADNPFMGRHAEIEGAQS